jgi:hypothetical protein
MSASDCLRTPFAAGYGTREPLAWELVCHVCVTSLPQVSRHRSLSVSSSQVRHETMMITSTTRQVPDPTCRRILRPSLPVNSHPEENDE